MLHFAKVGQKFARQRGELHEALFQRRVPQQRHVAGQNSCDLGVDFAVLAFQLANADLWIGFTSLAHLAQQLKKREQARFGAHETALAQRRQPGQCPLGRRREIEMRFVGTRWVELAQPGFVVGSPVVQILQSTLGVSAGATLFA